MSGASGSWLALSIEMTTDFCHLHVRSWFSFLAGGSSPRALARCASAMGMPAIALTDLNGVYGIVRFQKACKAAGVEAIVGAEVVVEDRPLVLLARSMEGYRNLCLLLTEVHLENRDNPATDLQRLSRWQRELICLTGGRAVATSPCMWCYRKWTVASLVVR